MIRFLRVGLALGCSLAFALPASASYQTFFAEDIQDEANTPLSATPNSDAAQAAFRVKLQGSVGTETFENIAAGTGGPLPIAFPTVNLGTVTATLSGGAGVVKYVPVGTSDFGVYSIPSATSSRVWSVDAGGNFEVKFNSAVAAFGFYGIDVGDFGADVAIDLLDANNNVIAALSGLSSDMDYTRGTGGSTDGSVFFFGFVAGSSDPLFNGVRFRTSSTNGDTIGFDNFSVALRSQLAGNDVDPPVGIPEPAGLALFGAAALAAGIARRRRQT